MARRKSEEGPFCFLPSILCFFFFSRQIQHFSAVLSSLFPSCVWLRFPCVQTRREQAPLSRLPFHTHFGISIGSWDINTEFALKDIQRRNTADRLPRVNPLEVLVNGREKVSQVANSILITKR
jgi:hypothetical protein